jgi:hypothetical protein
MSDLLSVVPAINIKLFIVALWKRQVKVMKELRRPTFQKASLLQWKTLRNSSIESKSCMDRFNRV